MNITHNAAPPERPTTSEALGFLFNTINKYRAGELYTIEAGGWQWVCNASPMPMPLERPMHGPVSVMHSIGPRMILIFHDHVLAGYLTETGGGFGVRGKRKQPTMNDMLDAFTLADLGAPGDAE